MRPVLSILLAFLLLAGPLAAAPQTPGGDTVPPAAALPRMSRPVSFDNSPRVHELIRAGNLYLSLQDALALAIENNLDIELERFLLPQSDSELQRAKGGGTLRGLNFTLLETPAGVGGPLGPLVTNAANTGVATSGTSVATNALELNGLGEAQTNLSMQGTVAQSNGTPVPVMDPAVTALVNWAHTSQPQTSYGAYGTNALISSTANINGGIQQGFSTGAQVGLSLVNGYQSWNATAVPYSSYTGSALGLNVTQPLLRGFGPSLNRRFIRIAANEQRITSLLFRQQLIATCFGVIRLYTDFVALYEDRKVKQETVILADKLLSDVDAQVQEGTLAPVEKTRAGAEVFSARQDLINAAGLVEEQEAVLKNVLTRRGNEDSEVLAAHIVPTDALSIPDKDEVRPIQDLIAEALANRPDLGQAQLQVENSNIGLQGSRNATLPEVDLVGIMQNNGFQGSSNPFYANTQAALYGGYGGVLGQVLARDYPTYGVGLQVTLPIHNRIAEADLARDELQVKQSEIRVRQLQNQARLEVEDALIAMRRARASYQAATEARKLQQESLEAEQSKFEVGASTTFFVIQYENLLAQAKSTEVAAMSSYVKARAALERATGTILETHQVSFDAAVKGRMQ
jgi:outer membrane protein TolC